MIDSRSVCLQNCFHIAFQIADLILMCEIDDHFIIQAIDAHVRLEQLAPLELAQVMIRVALNLFRIPSLCQPQ